MLLASSLFQLWGISCWGTLCSSHHGPFPLRASSDFPSLSAHPSLPRALPPEVLQPSRQSSPISSSAPSCPAPPPCSSRSSKRYSSRSFCSRQTTLVFELLFSLLLTLLNILEDLGEVSSKARKIPKDIASFQGVQEHVSKSKLNLVQQLVQIC